MHNFDWASQPLPGIPWRPGAGDGGGGCFGSLFPIFSSVVGNTYNDVARNTLEALMVCVLSCGALQ
jgi:hypothetical protein